VPDGEVGELLVDAPPPAKATGISAAERQTFEATGPTGDKYIRDSEAVIRFAAAATTCSGVGICVAFEVESALITPSRGLEAAVVPEAIRKGLLKRRRSWCCGGCQKPTACTTRSRSNVKQKSGVEYPRWIDVVDSLPKTATGRSAVQIARRRAGKIMMHSAATIAAVVPAKAMQPNSPRSFAGRGRIAATMRSIVVRSGCEGEHCTCQND